jgi:hypothetical protein
MIRRVRLFKSLENDITNLENEMNRWIEETGGQSPQCHGESGTTVIDKHFVFGDV